MIATQAEPARPAADAEAPVLRDGDAMDQPVFHALYEASPPDLRAELIGGIVRIMPSPVTDDHSVIHAHLVVWLGVFSGTTIALRAQATPSLVLGSRSEPEPDACLRLRQEYGGISRVAGRYVNGAPELVAEVSLSSAAYDLGAKKRDYERAGVQEYVVVLIDDQEVRWFALEDGRYAQLVHDTEDILKSRRFPGLWLDPQALLAHDLRQVQAALARGVQTTEHQAWVRSVEDRSPA